jgi:aryl-alcohol dehydrogenase-like predicted oxidoreductase
MAPTAEVRRMIGDSSLEVSTLGIGTAHFGAFVDQKCATQIIETAIDHDVNLIDTAPIYGDGNSEEIIGNITKKSRDNFVLATKFGLKYQPKSDGSFGIEIEPQTPEKIRASVERSLSYLKTDRIDLLQLHAFDNTAVIEDVFGELADLKSEGKVLNFGCSNYSPEEVKLTVRTTNSGQYPKMISGQCHFNFVERQAANQLGPIFSENGIGMICNRALNRGLLTGKYKLGESFPSESRAVFSNPVRQQITDERLKLVASLERFSMEAGHTMTELSISWLLSHAFVSSVLVGVRNIDQLDTCINSMDWTLSTQQLADIDSIVVDHRMLEAVNTSPKSNFE